MKTVIQKRERTSSILLCGKNMQKLRQIKTRYYKYFLIIRPDNGLSPAELPLKVTELSMPKCIQEGAQVHWFGGSAEEILGDF